MLQQYMGDAWVPKMCDTENCKNSKLTISITTQLLFGIDAPQSIYLRVINSNRLVTKSLPVQKLSISQMATKWFHMTFSTALKTDFVIHDKTSNFLLYHIYILIISCDVKVENLGIHGLIQIVRKISSASFRFLRECNSIYICSLQ